MQLQHIKNFTIVERSSNSEIQDSAPPGTLFLESDDGQDWYKCQTLFSDNTAKFMYDVAGIIWGVINKPVQQRGAVYAVSMLWPVDMSVVEIELESLPAGCVADGTWQYVNGEITKIPVDYVALAENKKSNCLANANTQISWRQDAVDAEMATEEEFAALTAWKKYRVLLMRVDTAAPVWPTAPEKQAS